MIWARPWGVRVSPRANLSGRGGGWLHGPSAGRWTLPLPVAGRTDPEGQGGRQDRQRQRGGGNGGQWRGQAGDHWDGRGYQYGAFWLAFLRSLSARGLSGVELVVSDAHQGLRGAIAAVFGGASWQRYRTHFMTNLLTRVPSPTMGGHHGAHHLPATLPR